MSKILIKIIKNIHNFNKVIFFLSLIVVMSNEMINFLSTLISYPSISSNPNNSQDSKNLANFIIDSYTNLGFKMELIDNLIEGKIL